MIFVYFCVMKERQKVTLPEEAQDDLAKIAMQRSMSVSTIIRGLVLDFLQKELKKHYTQLQHGGRRPGAGRKSAPVACARKPPPAAKPLRKKPPDAPPCRRLARRINCP